MDQYRPRRTRRILLICLIGGLLFTGCEARHYYSLKTAASPTILPTRTVSLNATPTLFLTTSATVTVVQSPTPTATPLPTASPTATQPASAAVKGMFGYGQLLALTCEARAAADWARHFGITIHELDFFARLPKSKNPEQGFVGSPNGGWGNIPPDAYGVHAGPVAKVLHDYGAQARAMRYMSLDELRVEIAAGRPVIVWVTGHVEPGKGVEYKVDGQTVTVARYEHTVIVTGYDEKYITILDGKTVYKRPIDTFLNAWSPLEDMAIIWVKDPLSY